MAAMSKTAALKAASSAVGRPIGSRTSWRFFAPYYDDQPNGPSSEYNATSYAMIKARRAEKVVSVALALMGIKGDVYLDGATGSTSNLLNLVLSDPKRYLIQP